MTSEFQAGAKFGQFILDEYVGRGSFGVVWRGHAEGNEQLVAVKILTGALADSATSPVRADVELLAAAAASRSAHVVKVLGGGVDPVPYIVMEFIQGDDLQSLLKQEGRLSSKQTIEIGLAMSDALSALYQAGIIHRDIKPANVMIDKDGVIKLADFGIARIVGYDTVSTTGQTAMTMAYAAPEIWDENGKFGRPSHRSDLYAMGILLYQCLSGSTPFSGNYSVLYRAHTEVTPDISALPAETPASLRILIRRCLAKRQEDRPKDAAECIALLKRAEVESADASAEPLNEPRKFGPWLKDRPHESVPWAWRCHHERTGQLATVEIYFYERLEAGERLSRTVEANAKLAPLGAEHLLGSSRLLLYPNESWRASPTGEFQFWLAREDLTIAPASVVTESDLAVAVHALAELLEASKAARTTLDFGIDNLTVTPAGGIYLRRPGLGEPEVDAEASVFTTISGLPLDEDARRVVDSASDFRALVSQLGAFKEDATVVVDRTQGLPEDTTTIVTQRRGEEDRGPATVLSSIQAAEPPISTVPEQPSVKASEPAASFKAVLRPLRTSTRLGPAKYEIVLENKTQLGLTLRLNATSTEAAVTLAATARLEAGASQALPVSVRSRKRRWWGRSLQHAFAISVSEAAGGQVQTCQGAFRDESHSLLLSGVAGLSILVVAVLVVMSGGGGGTSPAIAARGNLDRYEFATALSNFNKAIEREPNNASLFSGRSRAQLSLGNLEAASSDADKALALDSANAEANFLRSLAYDWLEHRDEALAMASKAIELRPKNASYLAHRALLYGDRDADAQWADANKAVELDPNSAEAHRALGSVYRYQKRYQDAEAEYTKAISLDANNGLRYANRAALFFAMEDYERTLGSLDENRDIIDSYPLSSAEGHWVRGATYLRQEKYRDALRELSKAIDLVPLAPSFYDWRGYCYYLMDNYEAATADLNKAIEIAPAYADPYYVRSLLLKDQDNLNGALQDANKAIALDPSDANYHGLLASVYWRLDNYPAAITEATKTIQLDPKHAEAYNVRSLAKGEQGQYNDALADISKAIELKPDSALFFANRASLYIDTKNYQGAVGDMNRAISLEPNDAGFYNRRGVAYYGLDNNDAAIADYSRAIQNDPTVFQYYMNRGLAEQDAGRKAEARADYDKAKSLATTPEEAQRAQTAIDSLGR